jgi:invasion protein IalB
MRSLTALAFFLLAASGVAAGQTTQSSARVTISGWHLECNPTGAKVACRILNQISQAPSGGLVLGFSLNPNAKGTTDMTLQVPLGVAVATPVEISTSAVVTQNFPIITCSPQGCFAAAPVSDTLIAAMRAGKSEMKATYTLLDANFAPHAVTVSLPLAGFSEVYDKLKS